MKKLLVLTVFLFCNQENLALKIIFKEVRSVDQGIFMGLKNNYNRGINNGCKSKCYLKIRSNGRREEDENSGCINGFAGIL